MVTMAKDNQIAVRMNDPTHEAVKTYAEKYDLTKAEAVRQMSERVLRGEGYLDTPGPAIADGGTIEDRIKETEEEVTKLQADLAKAVGQLKHMSPSFVITFLWLVLESTELLSPIGVGLSGIGVILLVLANYYWVIKND